jgi:hypothetical protein
MQFIDPMKQFCRRCGIKTKTVSDRLYLLDVQLVERNPQAERIEG